VDLLVYCASVKDVATFSLYSSNFAAAAQPLFAVGKSCRKRECLLENYERQAVVRERYRGIEETNCFQFVRSTL
jgi:hypothetical protein